MRGQRLGDPTATREVPVTLTYRAASKSEPLGAEAEAVALRAAWRGDPAVGEVEQSLGQRHLREVRPRRQAKGTQAGRGLSVSRVAGDCHDMEAVAAVLVPSDRAVRQRKRGMVALARHPRLPGHPFFTPEAEVEPGPQTSIQLASAWAAPAVAATVPLGSIQVLSR